MPEPPKEPEPVIEPYNLIVKMSFDELLKKYPMAEHPYEYELLYIICQMPSGLFESDLYNICELN